MSGDSSDGGHVGAIIGGRLGLFVSLLVIDIADCV